jgi:hypothetical protein
MARISAEGFGPEVAVADVAGAVAALERAAADP